MVSNKHKPPPKKKQSKENKQKVYRKNITKLRSGHSQLLYRLSALKSQKIAKKKFTAPETCGVTKCRSHHTVSLLQFSKNFKNTAP